MLPDYPDYIAYQERVSKVWNDRGQWTRMSTLNTISPIRMGVERQPGQG